jgi:cytochrome c oxidase accessory protein FixG
MEMLFRKVEYVIEGDAAKQRLLKSAPWSSKKIRIKATKHFAFYLLSFIIANFFLSYIIGVDELKKIITEPVGKHIMGLLSILIFSGVFYAVYAYFREQACTVICPYGRLQSVLLDRNSMIVAYDYKRGEPRGKFKKNTEAELNLGDCIDCFQCVKVCPTGIDIRNGTQMECVGCTACIDACDKMMEAVGRPKGLVRYASENNIADGSKLRFTGRMKFYSLMLVVLTGILTTLLVTRKDVGANIERAAGILYQERGTDSISNLYTIKVVNKTLNDIPLTLRIEDAPGRVVEADQQNILVRKEAQGKASFFIILPRNYINKRKTAVRVGLYQNEKKIMDVKTNFMGPFNRL